MQKEIRVKKVPLAQLAPRETKAIPGLLVRPERREYKGILEQPGPRVTKGTKVILAIKEIPEHREFRVKKEPLA